MHSVDWSAVTPREFEEVCMHLLRCLGFFDLQLYGQQDRDRDIVGKKIEKIGLMRKTRTWIIQCKRYISKSVSASDVANSLNWVKDVHQPDCFLLIAASNLTSSAKDYLKEAEKKYPFRTYIMEKQDVERHIIHNLERLAPVLPDKLYTQIAQMDGRKVPGSFEEWKIGQEYAREMKEICTLSKNYRVLVVGDILLDHVLIGDIASSTVVQPHGEELMTYTSSGGEEFERFSPGGAAWTAKTLSHLCKVILVGLLGNDHEANLVKMKLKEEPSVELKEIVAEGTPTIRKHYFVIKSKGEIPCIYKVRFDREDSEAMGKLMKPGGKLIDEVEKTVVSIMSGSEKIDAIVIDDYEKGLVTRELVETISELAKKNNSLLFVDPKYDWKKFVQSDIHTIIPNVREALFGIGWNVEKVEKCQNADIKDVATYAKALVDKYPNCRNFVIKADQRGAIYISKKTKEKNPIDTFIVSAINVGKKDFITGICCGGVFDAYLVAGVLTNHNKPEKSNMEELVSLANFAAGLRCEKHLGSPTKVEDVIQALEEKKYAMPVSIKLSLGA